MLPIPAATTTLSNTLQTSQPVFNSFIPYGYMEIGVMVAGFVVLFIIAIFWSAIKGLFSGHSASGRWDTIKNDQGEYISAPWAKRK